MAKLATTSHGTFDETPRFQRYVVLRTGLTETYGTMGFTVAAKSPRHAIRRCIRGFGHMLGCYDRRGRGSLICHGVTQSIDGVLMH